MGLKKRVNKDIFPVRCFDKIDNFGWWKYFVIVTVIALAASVVTYKYTGDVLLSIQITSCIFMLVAIWHVIMACWTEIGR